MIKWQDEFRIGVETIDEQHQHLFAVANEAYSLLRNDLLADKYDQITAIFAELAQYTVYHFQTEEEYMQRIGYPKLLSHKLQHDDFITRVGAIDLKQVEENQNRVILDILDFMVNWIAQHILQEDKQITQWDQ